MDTPSTKMLSVPSHTMLPCFVVLQSLHLVTAFTCRNTCMYIACPSSPYRVYQLYILTYDSLLTLQYYKSIDSMIVN